LTSVLRQ